MIDNNEQFILSFFNQYIFQSAKNNIEHLKYFYNVNPATSGNPLIHELLNAIDTYSFDTIGEPLFRTILNKCRKTPQESEQIIGCIIDYKKCTKEQISPSIKYLNDVIATSVINSANNKFKGNPSEYLKYLKNANIEVADSDVFKSTKFTDLDINSILADDSSSVIKTNVRLINDAFPGGGLERSQIGIICAPPGVGKTLMSMNLALYFASTGVKTLYVTLGDMNAKDWIIRGSSIAFGMPFKESYNHIKDGYLSLLGMVGDNLEISINQSGVVTAEEIVQRTLDGNFEAVFIDYDSNAKLTDDGVRTDSMYDSFGDFYNKLTKLSLSGILTIVCAQPKVYVFDKLINFQDIGESSRKVHIADFIITISNVTPECPNHLYIMQIAKARRGNVGERAYMIRLNNGRFMEIPRSIYELLIKEEIKKDYTEEDIKTMIQNNSSSQNFMNKALNQNNQKPQRIQNNPFSN